jgi:peptide chain release factor 3
MTVKHPRLGRDVRLSRAFRLFGREREPIDEAYPGDVIGVISPGLFTIGDTVTTGEAVPFADIPRFPSEHFATLVNIDITKYKQFHKGIEQLEEEGAVQVLYPDESYRKEPILAAVGELQFDVVLSNRRCLDRLGQTVILFSSDWDLEYTRKQNPDIIFEEIG